MLTRVYFCAISSAAAGIVLLPLLPSSAALAQLPAPYLVKQIANGAGSNPALFTPLGQNVFFSATDGSSGFEPYVSDGTSAGTLRLGDLVPGSSGSNPSAFAAVNGRVYFRASGGDANNGNAEMWTSDGTVAGTFRVADVNNNSTASLPAAFVPFGSQVLFSAAGADGRELYTSNGIAGAQLLQDLYPGGSSDPQLLTPTTPGGKVYFTAYTPAVGRELYSIAPGGTAQLVADIRTQVATVGPDKLTPFMNKLVFSAYSEDDGVEPWVTDGTAVGTAKLATIAPGNNSFGFPASSLPYAFQPYKDKLLFAAQSSQTGPFALYVSGGTPGDVQKLHDITVGTTISDDLLRAVGDRVFWQGRTAHNDAGLWVSDGSSPSLLMDLYPANPRGEIWELLPLGKWLLVVSQDRPVQNPGDPNLGGFELWMTDGTAADTVRLTTTPWSQIQDLTLAGDHVFFHGWSNVGPELYAMDVTSLLPDPAGGAGLLLIAAMALRRRRR